MGGGPYRVVQWATGNIGSRSLRAVIEHPELELVGLYVYSDAKAGQDAGELCGLGPTGVRGDPGRRRDPRPPARLRALHGRPGRHRRPVPAARIRGERRVDAQRVPPSPEPRPRRARAHRVGLRPRRLIALQHGLESRLHHRSVALRPALAPATPGPAPDRGVRRHVVAQLTRDDLRPHGLRPRPGQVRPPRGRGARRIVVRRFAGDGGRCPLAPARRRRGERSGGDRPPARGDRSGTDRGRHHRARSASRCRACRAAVRS